MEYYWFNIHALPVLFTGIMMFASGIFVLLKHPLASVNRSFFLICLSVTAWLIPTGLGYLSKYPDQAQFWFKCDNFGVMFISVTVFHFVSSFLQLKRRAAVRMGYLVALLFGFAVMFTDWLVIGVHKYSWGYFPRWGFFSLVFFTIFFGYMAASFYSLWSEYRKVTEPVRKNQIKYLFLAFVLAYTGSVDYLPAFGIPIYPFGFVSIFIFLSMVALTIVKYRLLDITLAMTRGTIFTLVYAIVLGIPLPVALSFQAQLEQHLGTHWWISLWVACAILATAAHYVNLYFQRRAEARLLREQRRYQTMLLNSAKGMTQIHNLQRLLKLLAYLLVRAMKLGHASVFLWDDSREQFVLQVKVHPPCKMTNSPVEFETHEPLVRWLTQERAPVVQEEISQLTDTKRSRTVSLSRLEARLKNLDAAVVVPSFVNDRLIGFLALGNKRTNQMYSEDDLSMLQTLANQAALAIENAQFYQKEREHQAELFHAASIADLGTMASSMSHQLNNPFCIIAGTAQNREEYLRRLLKQSVELPESVRKLLQDELESLKSIQEEATEGSNIIATIRGITASSEESRPLMIAEAVGVALPVAQYKVPFNRIDFRQELPDDLPKIWGNRAQLAQCLISFIENAWDAINLKQERLQPPPDYKGLIRLAASTVTEPDPATKKLIQWLTLTIGDNGIGLKPEDLRKLFIPFFTTKATAEKAMGSLFVVRRIIEAHEGSVTADSIYGTGTTFKVRLPVLTDEQAQQRIAAQRVAGNGPIHPHTN
ncbi:MAG: GAF domain-containing protein [Candidatus Omnitrophica bacterium]|nr:GAF domain-containing protein [Candidatus Omnitrophota bacterium]